VAQARKILHTDAGYHRRTTPPARAPGAEGERPHPPPALSHEAAGEGRVPFLFLYVSRPPGRAAPQARRRPPTGRPARRSRTAGGCARAPRLGCCPTVPAGSAAATTAGHRLRA